MKVLIVDDHELFRAGLRLLLGTLVPNYSILEAADVSYAKELAESQEDIELCLLDLGFRSQQGLEALQEIRTAFPDLPVVVVSGCEEPLTIRRCIDFGAMSYIPKTVSPNVLLEALAEVLAGRVYLPAHVDEMMANYSVATRPILTSRQREVLQGLCQGLSNKSIAKRLAISEYTVREYIQAIFRTLGVHNRTEAVICSSRLNLEAAE